MKQLTLLYLFLSTSAVQAQTFSRQSLELSLQLRREKQADYVTRFGNVSYQNDLRLHGTSVGVDIGYSILNSSFFIKASVGYYRFSIDNIVNERIPAGATYSRTSRAIDYRQDNNRFGYLTSKYNYNNLALGFEFGKGFSLKKNLLAIPQLALSYLTTFSQHYKIGIAGKDFRTTNNRSLGYLLDYKIGLRKEFNNMHLTTNFILPLYKNWRQDKVFLEDPNNRISTWLGGCGLSIGVGKYL